MRELVNLIISNFKNIFSKEFIVFFISLFPILELRGGMLAATILKVPLLKAMLLSFIGNIIPIPFVLLFFNKILEQMEKINFTKKFALWLRKKAEKNKPSIDKYGFWGLVLFVGIPLPGTGAWTGSLVASVFHMDIKRSALSIFLGILLALCIMALVYLLIGKII